MRSVILCVFATFCILQQPLFAQPVQPSLTLSGGMSIPLGTFAERNPEPLLRRYQPQEIFQGTGGAYSGWSLWADLTSPIRKSHVWGWMNSVGVIYQPTRWHEMLASDDQAQDVLIRSNAWWFITPVTGLQSRLRLHPQVQLVLYGQVGVLMGRRPGMTIRQVIHTGSPLSIGEYTYRIEPSWAAEPVWMIGVKGQIFRRIYMDVRYLKSVPVYSVPLEVTSDGFLVDNSMTHRIRQPIEMIQGTIGLIW